MSFEIARVYALLSSPAVPHFQSKPIFPKFHVIRTIKILSNMIKLADECVQASNAVGTFQNFSYRAFRTENYGVISTEHKDVHKCRFLSGPKFIRAVASFFLTERFALANFDVGG